MSTIPTYKISRQHNTLLQAITNAGKTRSYTDNKKWNHIHKMILPTQLGLGHSLFTHKQAVWITRVHCIFQHTSDSTSVTTPQLTSYQVCLLDPTHISKRHADKGVSLATDTRYMHITTRYLVIENKCYQIGGLHAFHFLAGHREECETYDKQAPSLGTLHKQALLKLSQIRLGAH